MGAQSNVDWVAIRAAFADGGPVSAIAKRFGVSRSAIYRRRRVEGWTAGGGANRPEQHAAPAPADGGLDDRTATAAAPTAAPAAPAAAPMDLGANFEATPLQALKARLHSALGAQMTRLEIRMRSDEPLNAADHERETRALTAIVRTYERLIELEAANPEADRSTMAVAAEDDDADTQDAFRRDVAARIVRLRAQLKLD